MTVIIHHENVHEKQNLLQEKERKASCTNVMCFSCHGRNIKDDKGYHNGTVGSFSFPTWDGKKIKAKENLYIFLKRGKKVKIWVGKI